MYSLDKKNTCPVKNNASNNIFLFKWSRFRTFVTFQGSSGEVVCDSVPKHSMYRYTYLYTYLYIYIFTNFSLIFIIFYGKCKVNRPSIEVSPTAKNTNPKDFHLSMYQLSHRSLGLVTKWVLAVGSIGMGILPTWISWNSQKITNHFRYLKWKNSVPYKAVLFWGRGFPLHKPYIQLT